MHRSKLITTSPSNKTQLELFGNDNKRKEVANLIIKYMNPYYKKGYFKTKVKYIIHLGHWLIELYIVQIDLLS